MKFLSTYINVDALPEADLSEFYSFPVNWFELYSSDQLRPQVQDSLLFVPQVSVVDNPDLLYIRGYWFKEDHLLIDCRWRRYEDEEEECDQFLYWQNEDGIWMPSNVGAKSIAARIRSINAYAS